MLNAQVIQQTPLDFHHILHRNRREIPAIGLARLRIKASWPGRASTPAQQVRADHEEPPGVDYLAWPDDGIPPARVVRRLMLGDMRIPTDRVAHEHRVVFGCIELTKRFVRDCDAGEVTAQLKRQRLSKG